MASKLYEETNIQAIADAIRAKNGLTDTYTIGEMAPAIQALTGSSQEAEIISGAVFEHDNAKVTSIAAYAFYKHEGISKVNLANVTSVKDNAYNGCTALSEVNMPELLSISQRAFYGCTVLAKLVIEQTAKVCTLSNANAFSGTRIASGIGYIYVPDELVDSYKAATNWATYANQIKGLNEMEA